MQRKGGQKDINRIERGKEEIKNENRIERGKEEIKKENRIERGKEDITRKIGQREERII